MLVIGLLLALMQTPATPPMSMPHLQDSCSGISAGPVSGPRVLRAGTCGLKYWDLVLMPTPGIGWVGTDGRQSTTTRAGAVPCEVRRGEWEIVGDNTPCVNWRGEVESWALNTSYLSWGAELWRNPDPWETFGATAERGDQFTRICASTPARGVIQRPLPIGGAVGDWISLSCIARPNTHSQIRLSGAGLSTVALNLVEGQWVRRTNSAQLEADTAEGSAFVYVPNLSGCIDVKACWYTKTESPGRECWGGDAPVTCARDQHTISTDGWPTEIGEISITATMEEVRTWNTFLYVAASAEFRLETAHQELILTGGGFNVRGAHGPWVPGKTYRISMRRDDAGIVHLSVDGRTIASAAAPPFPWAGSATIGRSTTFNGSIGPIRIRSTP